MPGVIHEFFRIFHECLSHEFPGSSFSLLTRIHTNIYHHVLSCNLIYHAHDSLNERGKNKRSKPGLKHEYTSCWNCFFPFEFITSSFELVLLIIVLRPRHSCMRNESSSAGVYVLNGVLLLTGCVKVGGCTFYLMGLYRIMLMNMITMVSCFWQVE